MFCPGSGDETNGMAVVARLLDREGLARLGVDADEAGGEIAFVHGAWLPGVWEACRGALAAHRRLWRMPHGAYDPVRLAYHGWKKRLARPFERYGLRHAERILATCEAEREWIARAVPTVADRITVVDLKRFFAFRPRVRRAGDGATHVLYLGRRHPLKGVDLLEEAVRGLPVELRVESGLLGAEKARAWDWCDVLVLPTLSENFGLVVAEALAHGKAVVTTDGAPAWAREGAEGRLAYLKGFRDGSRATRLALLREAIREAAAE